MNRMRKLASSFICVAVGIIIILLGFHKSIKPIVDFIGSSRTAVAVVMGQEGEARNYVTNPLTVQYRPEGSPEAITVTLPERGRFFTLKEGDTITVYYDPEDHYHARDAHWASLYFPAIVLLLFTLPFFLFAFIYALLALLNRDSLFDLSGGAQFGGAAFQIGKLVSMVGAAVFTILLMLKGMADIPRSLYAAPYLSLVFIMVFIVTISGFLISAATELKRK